MLTFIIVLRVIHILAGAFWVGASFLLTGIVGPVAQSMGPEGGRFMLQLNMRGRLAAVMAWSAILNIVAGSALYWITSGGLRSGWVQSGTGLSLTVGAAAALTAFLVGYFVQNRAMARMVVLGKEIGAQGGPPSQEQGGELQEMGARIALGGRINIVLLSIAVIAMAAARYVA